VYTEKTNVPLHHSIYMYIIHSFISHINFHISLIYIWTNFA